MFVGWFIRCDVFMVFNWVLTPSRIVLPKQEVPNIKRYGYEKKSTWTTLREEGMELGQLLMRNSVANDRFEHSITEIMCIFHQSYLLETTMFLFSLS